jgi:hypothetical protein
MDQPAITHAPRRKSGPAGTSPELAEGQQAMAPKFDNRLNLNAILAIYYSAINIGKCRIRRYHFII